MGDGNNEIPLTLPNVVAYCPAGGFLAPAGHSGSVMHDALGHGQVSTVRIGRQPTRRLMLEPFQVDGQQQQNDRGGSGKKGVVICPAGCIVEAQLSERAAEQESERHRNSHGDERK